MIVNRPYSQNRRGHCDDSWWNLHVGESLEPVKPTNSPQTVGGEPSELQPIDINSIEDNIVGIAFSSVPIIKTDPMTI